MSNGQKQRTLVDGQLPGKGEQEPPRPTGKVPEMPAEDWRNTGLNLFMLLAQAYYKLLESAIDVPCRAVDLDLNHSYLWTLKSIRNLLDNHPDLSDFPMPFEPEFSDLCPSTILDVEWEEMVSPNAERFLSTVQEYVMNKGVYPPEKSSPAWIAVEMFKPSVTSAIEFGEAYRKRMNKHFRKLLAQTSKRGTPQAQSSCKADAGQSKAAPTTETSCTVGKRASETLATEGTKRLETTTPRGHLDWVKQAELVRALHRVLGEEESPDKSALTRAVQKGHIQSNGETGRKLLLQVDSVKAWLTRTREMDHTEVQQVVDAIMSEIRMRTK